MNTTHPKKRRDPIKVVTIDGVEHKFYEVQFADEILHSRYMIAEIQELYIRYGISEGFLKEISQLLIDRSFEATDFKTFKEDVVAIGQNLKGRIGMLAEKSMYLELACVYFMLEDEPEEYDLDWQTKKKAIWQKGGVTDFFIIEAFKLTNASQSTYTKDILAVFQAIDERLAQLPQI